MILIYELGTAINKANTLSRQPDFDWRKIDNKKQIIFKPEFFKIQSRRRR